MRERGKKRGPKAALPTSSAYLLDRFSVDDIRGAREHTKNLLEFHWKYYTELAFQRYEARKELSAALSAAACEAMTP